MKKFSKLLALGLALALSFGMTVSAEENPSVTPPVVGGASADKAVFVPSESWTAEEWKAAETAVENSKAGSVVYGREVTGIVNVYMMEAPDGWKQGDSVTETFENMPALAEGEGFVLYHFNKDGTFKEEIAVVWNADKKAYQAVITSFSPFVLVKVKGEVKPGVAPTTPATTTPATTTPATGAPVSPKTGETLPVAGMMAVLCLAGVVVCAKKARCNG